MDRNNKGERAPQRATGKAGNLNSRNNPFSDSNHLPSIPLQSFNAHSQNLEASVASSSRTVRVGHHFIISTIELES